MRSISVRSSAMAGLSPTSWESDVAVNIECLDSGPVDAVLIRLNPHWAARRAFAGTTFAWAQSKRWAIAFLWLRLYQVLACG